jgi:hypothetical protein
MHSKRDIWLAEVPFEDVPDRKVRPVLVIEGKGYYIDCWKMTTNTNVPDALEIIKWEEAGLNRKTAVILSKRIEL